MLIPSSSDKIKGNIQGCSMKGKSVVCWEDFKAWLIEIENTKKSQGRRKIMLQNKQDNKNIPIWFLYVAPLSLFFSMFLPFLYWEQQQRHIVIFTDIAITAIGSVALWTCIFLN